MFDFFNAALQQQRLGNAVRVSRPGTGMKTACVRFTTCTFCSIVLLLVGYYSHLLYLAWFPTEKLVREQLYHLSTQRYFFKKQPLPDIVDVAETEDAPTEDEQSDESMPTENDEAVPLTDNKADLRERVEQAMKDLHP